MKLLRTVLAVAVVAGFALATLGNVSQAVAQDKKAKKAFGKLVKIDLKDGVGTITIQTKTKDGGTMDKTFKVTKETKINKGAGKGKEPTPAAVSDLKQDTTVVVTLSADSPDTAAMVTIGGGGKKKPDAK
jgi:hypothetical protein